MSISFNRVIMGGRLTADPVCQSTNSGVSLVRFSLAVNRPYQKGKDQQADFIRCVAWRQSAEFLCQYGKKGSTVFLEGTLQPNSYEKEGVNVESYSVVADSIKIDFPPKNTPAPQVNPTSYAAPPQAGSAGDYQQVYDDDLPLLNG